MSDECLICKDRLAYLDKDVLMECYYCHKMELSKTKCINNHYVCNDCHMKGVDLIISYCKETKSKNPIEIIKHMMKQSFCHMHGPEHHIMVGCALITAFYNAGGKLDLNNALSEMLQRGKQVPGGACGFWGACGAAISSGMFISIVTGSTPLKIEPWGLSNKMTSKSLYNIGSIGGPRCCKRDSFLSILSAIEFVKDNLNVNMETSDIVCEFSPLNNQCIKERCPFNKINNK